MDNNILDGLYEATAEDMLFAIGLLLTEGIPAPYIHIFYRAWTREQLEVVGESFKSGLTLMMGGLMAVTISLDPGSQPPF